MGIPSVEEFSKNVTVSVGLVVALVILSFYLGKMYGNYKGLEAKQELEYQFMLDEVGGLRSDWERQVKLHEQRLEKLEDGCN